VKLLCQNRAEVNHKNAGGKTAIMCGIMCGSIYILILIIYFNVSNILASANGHTEIVKLLCQNNAELNLPDKYGDTALICGILFNLYFNLNSLF
jgi:ankyrin repeat protein